METIYNVDYFIKKFQNIPEHKWCIGELQDESGRRCFLGHCHPAESIPDCMYCSEELGAAIMLFHNNLGVAGYVVNNGHHPDYQQGTPKKRILQALYDIKAKQQPEVKERIVYVTVDAPVRELQKEILSLQ